MITACRTLEAATKRGTVALLALALCACAKDATEKPRLLEENSFPADYRSQVADLMRRQFNTATVHDASIAEPVLKTFLPTPRFVACVRVNAADGSGPGKVGKDLAAYFYAARITQIVNATVEQCDKSAYQPFPELQSH